MFINAKQRAAVAAPVPGERFHHRASPVAQQRLRYAEPVERCCRFPYQRDAGFCSFDPTTFNCRYQLNSRGCRRVVSLNDHHMSSSSSTRSIARHCPCAMKQCAMAHVLQSRQACAWQSAAAVCNARRYAVSANAVFQHDPGRQRRGRPPPQCGKMRVRGSDTFMQPAASAARLTGGRHAPRSAR